MYYTSIRAKYMPPKSTYLPKEIKKPYPTASFLCLSSIHLRHHKLSTITISHDISTTLFAMIVNLNNLASDCELSSSIVITTVFTEKMSTVSRLEDEKTQDWQDFNRYPMYTLSIWTNL